jgi:dihydropteroate synthase
VLDLGADIINDVGVAAPIHLDVAGPPGVRCLMHMHGEPQTMQTSLAGDIVPVVRGILQQAAQSCNRRVWRQPGS